MKKKRILSQAEETLAEIALLGHGLKSSAIDWANIGRLAVDKAQKSLAGRCSECGMSHLFDPHEFKKESK